MAFLIRGQSLARPKSEVLARNQATTIIPKRGRPKWGRLINAAVISK